MGTPYPLKYSTLDVCIFKSLPAVSPVFHCFIDAWTKDLTLSATLKTSMHFCIQQYETISIVNDVNRFLQSFTMILSGFRSFSCYYPFRQVILLETFIHMKYYSGVQVAQVFYPVFLHTIRLWAFPVRHFSYLLPYFFNFNVHIILNCQLLQFVLYLLQPIYVFSVHHRLVPYISPKVSTLLYVWYHTFSSCSFQFIEQFLLVWFK